MAKIRPAGKRGGNQNNLSKYQGALPCLIVVLGGMGSITGALIGGLFIGVVESLCGLFLGESLGQIGIFIIFILVLLFRPTGLFGARA